MSTPLRARPREASEVPAGAPSLVPVLAAASGVAVASNYYLQPLLALVARDLHVGAGAVGGVAALALLGYALGLVLLVPLGDVVDRRRLVAAMLALTTACLAAMSVAPSVPVLAAAAFGVGLTSVVAQVLLPYAAGLAGDASRGRVVGTVLSGVVAGIIGARVVGGLLGHAAGWRAVYGAAAALTACLLVVVLRRLPREPQRHRRNGRADVPYTALLRGVVALLRETPVLRLRARYGFCGFGVYSAVWTTLAFQLHDRFGLGPAAVSAVALLGVGSAAISPRVGRLADAGHATAVTGTAYAALLGATGLLAFGGSSLPLLLAGLLVADLAVQSAHVANLGVVYALVPQARSRATTAYMATVFLGGATGSLAAAQAYGRWGWDGVVVVTAAFAAAALLTWLLRLVVRAPLTLEEAYPEATG